jgi:hypothetical protein
MSLSDLKKLSPEERIRRLKEIEEKSKKEIMEAERLIHESEEDIKQRDDALRDIPIPQLTAVDAHQLFNPEEKMMFEMKREMPHKTEQQPYPAFPSLEETVNSEAPKLTEAQMQQQREYITNLARQPVDTLYQRLNELRESVNENGEMAPDERSNLYMLNRAISQKQDDIEKGIYNTSDRVDRRIDSSRRILEEMMGVYRR